MSHLKPILEATAVWLPSALEVSLNVLDKKNDLASFHPLLIYCTSSFIKPNSKQTKDVFSLPFADPPNPTLFFSLIKPWPPEDRSIFSICVSLFGWALADSLQTCFRKQTLSSGTENISTVDVSQPSGYLVRVATRYCRLLLLLLTVFFHVDSTPRLKLF